MVAHEILTRGAFVRGGKMLAFIVVCIVLAISATYELIEWWVALAIGQGADQFLGTQGDPWDTQSDMFFALMGAIAGARAEYYGILLFGFMLYAAILLCVSVPMSATIGTMSDPLLLLAVYRSVSVIFD